MANSKTCAACPAWHLLAGEKGECRCNPPSGFQTPDGAPRGSFPITYATEWCYRGRTIMGNVGT